MQRVERSVDVDDAQIGYEEPVLPPHLRLLCVSRSEPSWVRLALQLDADGCQDPEFRWVTTSGEALGLLRDEIFDCLVIAAGGADGEGEALQLIDGIRAAGCGSPIVVVAEGLSDRGWSLAVEQDCDVLLAADAWCSLALVTVVTRAVRRTKLVEEHRQLAATHRRRLIRERDEAEQLLAQQRQIVHELEEVARAPHAAETDDDESAEAGSRCAAGGDESPPVGERVDFPPEIRRYYKELLRTYVIMGSGNLAEDIARLAELLCVAETNTRAALDLHLTCVEELIRGLGNRSARHVMSRADVLALELVIHLGECYHRRLDSSPHEETHSWPTTPRP